MEILNIVENQCFKNYRELCNTLNISILGGNGKNKQLVELSRYVKFRKDKYNYIIEEIYSEPLLESSRRNKGMSWINSVALCLLHRLKDARTNAIIQDGMYVLYIPKYELSIYTGMCNEEFFKARVIHNNETPDNQVEKHYFKTASEKYNSVLASVQGFLKKRHDVYFTNTWIYYAYDDIRKENILDTDDTMRAKVSEIEAKLMASLGFSTKFMLFKSSLKGVYDTRLKEELKVKLGMHEARESVKFIFSDQILSRVERLEKELNYTSNKEHTNLTMIKFLSDKKLEFIGSKPFSTLKVFKSKVGLVNPINTSKSDLEDYDDLIETNTKLKPVIPQSI
jgi:hypothetical protein